MTIAFDPHRLAQISRCFRRAVDHGLLPGFDVRVNIGQSTVLEDHYGQRDLERSLPVEADTIYRVVSMTKPMTSVATLMLYERGLLDVRAPLSEYIPEFAATSVCRTVAHDPDDVEPLQAPLTAWHLLTHTSGLTYNWAGENGVNRLYQQFGIAEAYGKTDLATNVTHLAGLPLLFQPGTAWNYSVSNDVLGRLVEIVSGSSLDQFFQSELLDPLNMSQSGFSVPMPERHRIAQFYGGQPGGTTFLPMPATADPGAEPVLLSGGGGLFSTMDDYQRFVLALAAGGGGLISPETLKFATSNHLPGGADIASFQRHGLEDDLSGLGFGLGFAVVTDPIARRILTRKGVYYWNGAGGTAFFVDPASKISATFMMQVRSASNTSWEALLHRLVFAALAD
ncbi:CubicO group peptidase (beta-lactamase class C family) [Nakamurella sp. UYEF19]|uniref:serine hydrolase domain-containing protein n=1 Tax=Nakamurella sp. UYEF19 TaxID=1756392 RepID=UPI00339773DF